MHRPKLRVRSRWGLVLAGVALLITPVLASARLRDTLLRSVAAPGLTSEQSQTTRDVEAVQALLARVRGTNAFACELAMQTIDHGNWFGALSEISGSPVVDDSARLLLPHELTAPAVVEPLWVALRDPDGCVRRAAASLFGRTRAPGASERLRSAFSNSDGELRSLAAFALGLAEDQAAAAGLLTLLRDSSPTVRASAAWALGELEYKAAINPLAELLERDQSARVRRAAARALGQIAG